MQLTFNKVDSSKNKSEKKYTQWLKEEVQAAIDKPSVGIPHEEVMARMNKLIEDLSHGKR